MLKAHQCHFCLGSKESLTHAPLVLSLSLSPSLSLSLRLQGNDWLGFQDAQTPDGIPEETRLMFEAGDWFHLSCESQRDWRSTLSMRNSATIATGNITGTLATQFDTLLNPTRRRHWPALYEWERLFHDTTES